MTQSSSEEPASFWSLGECSQQVALVENEEHLEALRLDAQAAVVCGMDAEWPPEQQGHSRASLLQLALWSPERGLKVVLLDLLALPADAVRVWLQPILRNRQTLKVGYCMVMDLRAVAAALGGEGGGVVAVVEPALDVGTLHRFLLKHRVPGARKSQGPGLSGMIDAQLGAPLDKAQQCSAWGRRPLAPEQLRYAADDAACLLALLDDLICSVPPEALPLGGDGSRGENGSTAGAGAGECSRHRGAGSACACEHASSSGPSSSTIGSSSQGQQTVEASGSGWTGMACGAAALQSAAEWWGSRLEVSGGRAVRQRLSRRARAKQQREAEKAEPEGFPVTVPWMDATCRLTGEPRFLCDVMAEGLARQLRLVGLDAESVPVRDKTQRYAVYRCLVERAEEEGRVVLTRDQTFIQAGYTYQAYLVRADTKQAQLQEVLRVFGLQVEEGDLLSRCASCNGEFIPEPLTREQLREAHNVPPGIREQHDEFWVCSRCSQCFWKGNQYGHAIERLTAMFKKQLL